MSRVSAGTPRGQERLGLCVFHIPVEGRLVPVYEVNTLGARERYYRHLAASGAGEGTGTAAMA